MAVDQFLTTYKNSLLNKQNINPLTGRNTPVASPVLGPVANSPQSPAMGSQIPDWLQGKTSGAVDRYMQKKSDWTSGLAQKYSGMAAGQIQTNEYGIPTDKLTDFSSAFNDSLNTIDQTGKSATQGAEAAAQWQQMQKQAELNAGYQINWAPGASGNNAGAKAVSIAMQAQGTPYVWGGNSLSKGVDCSGLVQQVYAKMGIKLPRTTYEQAKAGKVVSLGSLLPGDLVFYNTGSKDPNGIGTFSHVAIYIGNGQIIEAPGTGKNVRVSSIGNPSRAVRPW